MKTTRNSPRARKERAVAKRFLRLERTAAGFLGFVRCRCKRCCGDLSLSWRWRSARRLGRHPPADARFRCLLILQLVGLLRCAGVRLRVSSGGLLSCCVPSGGRGENPARKLPEYTAFLARMRQFLVPVRSDPSAGRALLFATGARPRLVGLDCDARPWFCDLAHRVGSFCDGSRRFPAVIAFGLSCSCDCPP